LKRRHERVATSAAALPEAAEVLPALAALVHEEPGNALSLPTWAIHVSSVLEWCAAMLLNLPAWAERRPHHVPIGSRVDQG
jgi:Protein of unknown function (DUF2499)